MLGNTKKHKLNRTKADQTIVHQIPPAAEDPDNAPNIAADRGIFLRLGIVLYIVLSVAGIAIFAAKNVPLKPLPEPMPGVRPFTYKQFRVTAYCPCGKCCGRWAKVTPRVTASGHRITAGDKFVAAPRSYRFGTEMTIPGYGTVKVLDRGGVIKGDRLDVYFDSHKEALQWGVKVLDVKVYQTERD